MNLRLVSQQMPLSPQKVRHWCTNNYVHFILHSSSHTWRFPSWTPWTSFDIPPHSQLASTPSTRQHRNMIYSSFQSLVPIQLHSKHTSSTFSSLETRGGKTGPTHWASLFSPLLLAGWVEVLNSSPLLGPPRLTRWKNGAGRLANLSTIFFLFNGSDKIYSGVTQ